MHMHIYVLCLCAVFASLLLFLLSVSRITPSFLPWCSLHLVGRGGIVDTSTKIECPTVSCCLPFEQLWLSVMVFICCTKKPWWLTRAILIYGHKEKCLDGFRKMAVVGSSVRCMTSLAMGRWLNFQCQAWIPSYFPRLKSSLMAVCCH